MGGKKKGYVSYSGQVEGGMGHWELECGGMAERAGVSTIDRKEPQLTLA